MTYWLVFATYDVLEDMMLPTFLFLFGGYYYPVKLGFFVWLQAAGSVWFFQNVVQKLVKVSKRTTSGIGEAAGNVAGTTDGRSPTHTMMQHQS